jgi:hypothetical protein
MKYTFECTENESIAYLALLGQVAKHVSKAVRESAKARTTMYSANRTSSSVVEPSESDGNDDGPQATIHPFRVVKPTEEEVEEAIVNEPEPLPADVVKKQKMIKKGEKAFSEFIHEWLKGIDLQTMGLVEGVEQPDRDLLLRATANGPASFKILTYVAHCGGLQRAIAKVTNDENLAVELSRYIVPPASIAFPDLADQYEYKNPFLKDEDE